MLELDDLINALQHIKAAVPGERLPGSDLPIGLEPMTALTDAVLAAWTTFLAAFPSPRPASSHVPAVSRRRSAGR